MHILLSKELLLLQIQIIMHMIRNWLLKSNASVISWISKTNNPLIDNAEDLNIVMPTYVQLNLVHQRLFKNNRKFVKLLQRWTNSGAVGDIDYSIKDSKSFDYKTSIIGSLEGNNKEKEVEIAVPLKHLSNFWRTLDITLINCEINLILTWSDKRSNRRCQPSCWSCSS